MPPDFDAIDALIIEGDLKKAVEKIEKYCGQHAGRFNDVKKETLALYTRINDWDKKSSRATALSLELSAERNAIISHITDLRYKLAEVIENPLPPAADTPPPSTPEPEASTEKKEKSSSPTTAKILQGLLVITGLAFLYCIIIQKDAMLGACCMVFGGWDMYILKNF